MRLNVFNLPTATVTKIHTPNFYSSKFKVYFSKFLLLAKVAYAISNLSDTTIGTPSTFTEKTTSTSTSICDPPKDLRAQSNIQDKWTNDI